MNEQMTPKQRTVKELIEILKQYPDDTIVTGNVQSQFSQLCTVQGNCPDEKLNNVGIYFWDNPILK